MNETTLLERIADTVNRLVENTGATDISDYFDRLENTFDNYDHNKKVFEAIQYLGELCTLQEEK